MSQIIQTLYSPLDEVIKVTSRRVNALENVVIPTIADNIQYIIKELDELEREDFTRLKKVVEKKNENENSEDMENDEGNKYQSESLESSNLGPSILDSYGDNDEADEDLLF